MEERLAQQERSTHPPGYEEGFFAHGDRAFGLAALGEHEAGLHEHRAELRRPLAGAVIGGMCVLDAALHGFDGLGLFALPERRETTGVEREPIWCNPRLLRASDALVGQFGGTGELARCDGGPCRRRERHDALGRWQSCGERQGDLEPPQCLAGGTPYRGSTKSRGEAECQPCFAPLDQPVECGAAVLGFGEPLLGDGDLIGAEEPADERLLELEVVVGVTIASGFDVTVAGQTLTPVLA